MRNSLFRRNFILTAGMILVAFALLTVAFMTLSYRYMVQDKKQSLTQNAVYAATLIQSSVNQYYGMGGDTFPIYSPAISGISESDLLVCDASGVVLRYTSSHDDGDPEEETDADEYIGATISSSVADQLLTQGSYADMSDLGIYTNLHFVSGATIHLDTGDGEGQTLLVLMSTSASELLTLWRALATLFFFVAVVVLIIAFISSSIFSLQQVKPLRDMGEAVRRFGMGEYGVRMEYTDREDEIGDLAVAFNSMADSLASSEERRQEFLANISHELKTPMTTISGYTNGILDGTIPPERVNETLQIISNETARLSRLVRRMLDASSLQAAGSSRSQMEFDICETVVQAVISLEGKIRSRQLDMDMHIPDGAVSVWGDPDSIAQVCYNLLDNAAKFATPGTAIVVTVATKGGKAHISVKNEGETIPPEELGAIFDRFHKSDRSRGMDKEGVGLGLYIVKTILNNHRENITVTSADGVTEFAFTLTLAG